MLQVGRFWFCSPKADSHLDPRHLPLHWRPWWMSCCCCCCSKNGLLSACSRVLFRETWKSHETESQKDLEYKYVNVHGYVYKNVECRRGDYLLRAGRTTSISRYEIWPNATFFTGLLALGVFGCAGKFISVVRCFSNFDP